MSAGLGYVSSLPENRDRFGQLVRSEWTKLRSVRSWVFCVGLAAVLMLGICLLSSYGSTSSINGVPGHPPVPTGPAGESVTDSFFLVQQPIPLTGTVTVRLSSLVGNYLNTNGGVCPFSGGCGPAVGGPTGVTGVAPGSVGNSGGVPGGNQGLPTGKVVAPQPWAKAGLIVKASDTPGSAYAAVMVTGSYGARMQWDYTGDTAGVPGAVSSSSPRWLRLTRDGDVVTGYDSENGTDWSEIDSVTLSGLPATAVVGMFVASPQYAVVHGHSGFVSPTIASATFDDVDLAFAGASPRAWHGVGLGQGFEAYPTAGGGYRQSGGTFTVAGSGDIAPVVAGILGNGLLLEQTLAGALVGVLVLVILATLYITGEYRRGLIHTTFSATPRRGRVLAAKALVIGAVSFVVGLVCATVAITVGAAALRSNGNLVYPVGVATQVRMVVGIALVIALCSVLALGLATVARRGAAVIVGMLVAVVVPQFLSMAGILPAGLAEWLLRLTPAAGFAVQQSLPAYSQVTAFYYPEYGYYPLPPWGGLLVLCAYAAASIGLAAYLLQKRDA